MRRTRRPHPIDLLKPLRRAATLAISMSVAALGGVGHGCPPSGERSLPAAPGRASVVSTAPQTRGSADESLGLDALLRGDAGNRQDEIAAAIRRIRREHFAQPRSADGTRAAERRAAGIAKLASFGERDAIEPLYVELRREDPDVTSAALDVIASVGDAGQAALAWIAINDDSASLRAAATERLLRPSPPAVVGVLDACLRGENNMIVNRAGSLAATLGATELIPQLILAQATSDASAPTGDLAWITFLRQRSYVANLVPVVGDNSGAFQPVIGVVNEGALLRIMDAVVITYRTEVHTALVQLTSADWGSSTQNLGYDQDRWRAWYLDTYLPFKERQAEERARVAKARSTERRDQYDDDL